MLGVGFCHVCNVSMYSARDGDNPDESSDEELFRLLVDDDDKGFLDGMLLSFVC